MNSCLPVSITCPPHPCLFLLVCLFVCLFGCCGVFGTLYFAVQGAVAEQTAIPDSFPGALWGHCPVAAPDAIGDGFFCLMDAKSSMQQVW